MKNLFTIAFATTALLISTGSETGAAEQGGDSSLAGAPGDLGFHNRDFRSQVGLGARRSGPAARYRSADGTSSYNCNNTEPGGDRTIRYPFSVPDSRVLEFVRIWGLKGANTADLGLRAYRSCMSQGQLAPTTSLLSEATLSFPGDQFSTTLTTGNDEPNNQNCKYWLEVEFGDGSTACASNHLNMRIHKMRIQARMPDRIFRNSFRVHVPG